jgi:iron transport multicopper oxidase
MAAFSAMYVWFQGCIMRVIEVDGIYTESDETSMLYLTAGQRYSVLLTVDNDASANIPFVASMDEVSDLTAGLSSNLTGSGIV